MDRECKMRTITENTDSRIKITSFACNNQDGIELPTLFNTEILDEVKAKNAVKGKEGELIISHEDSDNIVGQLNAKIGEMTISLADDDVNKYRQNSERGELMYDG